MVCKFPTNIRILMMSVISGDETGRLIFYEWGNLNDMKVFFHGSIPVA